MINNIVILGGYVNALGIVRQMGRRGLRVMVVTNPNSNLACYSRYVSRYVYYTSFKDLTKILKELALPQTLLCPTGDEEMLFLDQNREWLEKSYYLAIPSSNNIQLFGEKTNAYHFCEEHAIPYPKSYTLQPNGKSNATETMVFPVLLKPSVMYSFVEQFGQKAFVCRDAQELQERCDQIQRAGYELDKMIIQEFLTGGPNCLYSVGVFAINGEIKRQLQVNRRRQRPMILGKSTTYCVSSEIERLYELAAEIMQSTHYTGIAEIEFMYHDGEYKFLEVNTRSWKWHSISNAYGFSFLGEWINYLNGEKSESSSPIRAMWVERIMDWVVSIPEILYGRMKIKDFMRSYRLADTRKEYAVWSRDDIMPIIVYPLQMVRNVCKKMLKR